MADLGARLDGIGLKRSELADRLRVSKQAVTNWLSRGSWPPEAEELVAELERTPRQELEQRIGVNELVLMDGEHGRVVRRDRCELMDGRVEWLYHVASARAVPGGWEHYGAPVHRSAKSLRRAVVGVPVVWVDRKPVDGRKA